MYLVVTVKNGYYVMIQKIDDSLNFYSNALKFHPVTGSPNYVDSSLNNHKTMVAITGSYYFIMVNFQKFFQTSKVETVLFMQDFNILRSGMYSCNQWTPAVGLTGAGTSYTLTMITSTLYQTIYPWNYIIVLQGLDNEYIRLMQQNWYSGYYYP